jgi:4-hydroxyphenylpyruvate dioxygenase
MNKTVPLYPIKPITYKLNENPMGTDGFEFLEFTSPNPIRLITDFEKLGFTAVAKHRSKKVTLFKQGDINFILNEEPNSHAAAFANLHGDSVVAMGFRVNDAQKAFAHAISLGAKPFNQKIGSSELAIPAIYGIGDSLIYFIDRYGKDTIYDIDFIPLPNVKLSEKSAGLTYIDHVTHNVYKGNMNSWAEFYERIFNFHEVKYFDIQGQHTGLFSRAMTSACGKIRIPLNESKDDQSQIQEYLDEYKGEGIQHIALGTDDIYQSVEQLRQNDIEFLAVPDTYYEMLDDRVPSHNEDLPRLQKNRILVDGAPTKGQGLLLQLFTHNMLGPIFFEIIQRKGNDGFGHGNFQALFDAIERDQIKRGVIKV